MDQSMFEEMSFEDTEFMSELDDMFSMNKWFEKIKSKFFLFLFFISIK